MGRPSKIPPFSHYDVYKTSDIDFFISLFSGREELYNPCEEFSERRQKAFHFIEKKCGHFLAMRKGRNAEKLWLYLFNDFEKLIRNGGDRNDEKSKSITVFYDCLKFLIPYLETSDRTNLPIMPRGKLDLRDDVAIGDAKRQKLEDSGSPEEHLDDDWFQRVIETMTNQQSNNSICSISYSIPEPSESGSSGIEFSCKSGNSTTAERHADIISCVTNFLEEIPNEKLMLCKVRLFQFIEDEKAKMKCEK
ncbi:hypothetical protein GCK72_006233 [Caenorhabditis remanei]|uniref:Uncharacterized protein n=1 Tax=Caenorhabditis remanei TaxID=31234 RepID=A0A6A5HHV2_CAERE|nr:hypothetical protein GCK72_006233 [Caenorhabditis remanei]KAF1766277.1 hypothetical protein GCK72_006233 [Caenorhabditis remanei]